MLELKLGQVKIGLDFSFFAAIALFFCCDEFAFGLLSLAAATLHESGHLIAMMLTKCRVRAITFYGGGIKITREFTLYNSLFVLVAGSAANFAVFGLSLIFRENQGFALFGAVNMLLGIFNLIPVACFDGKYILDMWLERIFSEKNARTASEAISFVFSALLILCAVLTLVSGVVNFTFAAVTVYVLAVIVVGEGRLRR